MVRGRFIPRSSEEIDDERRCLNCAVRPLRESHRLHVGETMDFYEQPPSGTFGGGFGGNERVVHMLFRCPRCEVESAKEERTEDGIVLDARQGRRKMV